MHQKGTEADYFRPPTIDLTSASARFRHSGWIHTRRRIWEAFGRTAQSPSRMRAFGECGSYSWVEACDSNASLFRIRHNNCHDRLCTPCANARSRQLCQALQTMIPSQGVSFITVTLCGRGEALTDLIDRLYRSFRALRQHPTWEDAVTGGAAFLEIKWSDKAQRWHPHLHIIAIARFIDQGELSTIWRTITKDSFIVDIRRVRQIAQTSHYVTKYASKPLNTSFSNTPALLDEAIGALKGRRLCLCFGSWYGTALTEIDETGLYDDEEPKAGYHFHCDLESLLKQANDGVRDAINILKLAGVEGLWRQALTTTFDSS